MYRPVLVTPPAAKPLTLEEVKAHLDVSYTDKDTEITLLLDAAIAYLDGWTGILGRCLMPQTWRQDFDDFSRCLRLPLFQAASITSVKYDDSSAVEQTVSSSFYDLLTDDRGGFVRFKDTYSFAAVNSQRPAVRVAYVAGYADAASVPAAIKAAMLLLIRHWFDNPGAVQVGQPAQAMPFAVDALLAPYRRISF
ncbi:hypothetical protein ASD45_08525 [Pseudolabrys sp. Root1462]|uniref:head-tail connector protein n=1 Tax=Pseudolabrys sp. Root1462 TaxID=1736466 RepID=UPI0007027966|nr:head-tail connector protein [Pseudolabrys sp. Root1462]KQZ00898.1 hypothetical protein ASD45_08525 [Pseudolabrys sp. Root1462]